MVAVPHPSLAEVEHRPWPLPPRPWIMAQSWHDLLFAHWRVDAAALGALLPPGLALDTFAGEAWVGVVPFRMSGIRLRGLPAVPGTSAFPELNVRTYVTDGEHPGVWFFSLDAAHALAVRVARRWFHLPYFDARMRCDADGAGIDYASERTHRGAPPAALRARYRPTGEVSRASPGSLERWLTERYCLYARSPRGLLRGEIHHAPWPLQPAAAEIETNTMAAAVGIPLPDEPPLLHFARRIDVVCWAPVRV
jgi:uncharacterized protein YqjF (DUF2071 family)